MRIEDLSVNERILIHLKDFSMDSGGEGAIIGQTQEGIGEAIGIRINHVPRATGTLLEDGYIDEALVHVGGLKRKRKAFFLTARGSEIADELMAKLKSQKVLFKGTDGKETQISLQDIIFKARGYTISGLALSFFRDGVILESSLTGEPAITYLSTLEAVPEPETFVNRANEIVFLSKKITSGEKLLVVSGIKGIGKTSLVWKTLKEFEDRKNIFWYTLHEWDTVRSVMEQMSENHVRLGRNELKKFLRLSKDLDIGLSASTFLKDILDSESIIVIDNIFDLKKEVMQFIYMLCEHSRNLDNVCLILITRDRQSLSPTPSLGAMGSNDLVVKGLDRDSAMVLLERMGLDREDGDRVFAMTQGHPLALKLVNSDEIKNLIDTKGLTNEEVWVVRCMKAFDAIFD
jgi:hypothetical protein